MPFHVPAICIIYNLVVFESYVWPPHSRTHTHSCTHSLFTKFCTIKCIIRNGYIHMYIVDGNPARVVCVMMSSHTMKFVFFFSCHNCTFICGKYKARCAYDKKCTQTCAEHSNNLAPRPAHVYICCLYRCSIVVIFFYFYFSDTVLL